MKKVLGVYINAERHSATTHEMYDTLDNYYHVLNVDCIDIVRRRIGGREYSIVCDDEALLKPGPIISMVDGKGRPMLYGNLFITREKGPKLVSLTQDDVKRIMNAMDTFFSPRDGLITMLVGEY